MDLISVRQKTKIFSNSGLDDIDLDCYISKVSSDKLNVAIPPNLSEDFSDVSKGFDLEVKVYTPKGIAIFLSKVLKICSDKEIEISFNAQNVKIENTRQNPRYQTNCPITIFRPLLGNIDGHLIDVSIKGIRFYSNVPLDTGSTFEIMLSLSDTIGKIIFKGKVLDKTGLPDGVHRMLIEDISYTDRQKLTDFCMSLAG